MKLFIVVIFLAAVCASDATAEYEAAVKECSKTHNLKEVDVNKIFDGSIKPADITRDMKCVSLCLTEKDGITKDGEFQPQGLTESLSSYVDKAKAAQVMSACKDLKGTDRCETGYKILSCIIENMPKQKT